MIDKRKKNVNWFIAILLFFILIIFFNPDRNKPLQSVFVFISKPFTFLFSNFGGWTSEKFNFFTQIGEIKNKNEDLVNENLKLKFELAQLTETKQENEVLREQLGFKVRDKFELEACFILGQTLSRNRRIIYVDKGDKEGIAVGMPVIFGEGILIGRVSKVSANNSEVELILDKNTSINAEIQESGAKGIVTGEYGISSKMGVIPQTIKLEKGQTVITSGLGGSFPRGLLIGYINEYNNTLDQLFQEASLDFPVNFKNLKVVFIIKNFSIQ